MAISLVWCWMTDYDGWKTGKLTQPMPIHTTISRVPRQNYQMVRKIIICRCNKYYLCTIVTLCMYQCQWRVGRKVALIVHNVHVTIKVNISFYNAMCFKRAHFPVYTNLEFKTEQQMIWSNVWCVQETWQRMCLLITSSVWTMSRPSLSASSSASRPSTPSGE